MVNINIIKTFVDGDECTMPSKIICVNQERYIGCIYTALHDNICKRIKTNNELLKFLAKNTSHAEKHLAFKNIYYGNDIDWDFYD